MNDQVNEEIMKAFTEWALTHEPHPIRDSPMDEVQVGRSLRDIRDKRLHRMTHPNFYVYCARRFGIFPDKVDRLIAVGEGREPERTKSVELKKAEKPASVVYFVSGANLIKIGFTVRINTRLMDLRTASPIPLTLLATIPGNRAVEQKLHEQFAHLREHGEWFKADASLLAYIESLQSQGKDDGSS